VNKVEDTKSGMEILSKADAVMRELEGHGELSVAKLAASVGEPVSSTYRLITNLAAIGWVETGSKRGLYRLGVYAMSVGGRLEDRISVRDAALPFLKSLLEETSATSFLCVRRSSRAVCIERLEGRDVRSLALALGDSFPLYRGAAPLALLAFLPRSEREAVLDGFENQRKTDASVPTRSAIERSINTIRDNGYSMSDGDVTPGIASIGAPVYNHRGELEAAISISGLRAAVIETPVPTVRLVLEAAADVSRSLGFQGEMSAA
jgi:DNA-binding IclR family transcriptional regulator